MINKGMAMNYQEEYYKLIENYIFYELPDQKLIDCDERVALAIMKNYVNKIIDYEYQSYDRYKEIKFNEILKSYKNNKSFWEKANIQEYLMNEDFRFQFPEICFQFLTDKEFLLKFFSEKLNELVLNSLNKLISSEEFTLLEKSFLLSKGANPEQLKKYEHDEDFIEEMIIKRPYLYERLSDEVKENKKILNAYLRYPGSILSFPREKQNKLFYSWIRLHKNWDMGIIDHLDYEYLKPIMKKINKTGNVEFFKTILSRNVKKYKEVIVDFFQQNKSYESFIKMIRVKPLEDLQPILENIDYSFYLETWLNNYSYKKPENLDKKMFQLLESNPSLQMKTTQAFDYNIMKIINNNQNITIDLFKEALRIQFLKLDEKTIIYEKAEENMFFLKKYLTRETLKEMKLPNTHIIKYLQYIKFTDNFQDKGIKEKKLKI